MKKHLVNIFSSLIILSSCNNPEPNSECYQIYFNGSSNAFKFCPNGRVEVWDQGESVYDISCLTIGKWRMNGDDIIIENLFNPNCPGASRKNGSYYIPGTKDIDGSKHIWRSSDRNM